MQRGIFEAEHELSELRASLQAEQDALERRASGLENMSDRQRHMEEHLKRQQSKLEADRQAWANGASARNDAEQQSKEAQEALARLKVVLVSMLC